MNKPKSMAEVSHLLRDWHNSDDKLFITRWGEGWSHALIMHELLLLDNIYQKNTYPQIFPVIVYEDRKESSRVVATTPTSFVVEVVNGTDAMKSPKWVSASIEYRCLALIRALAQALFPNAQVDKTDTIDR